MNLKEKLAEAQKKLEDIMAKEDKTADELKAAMEEVKSAKANLEAAEEAEKLLGSMKGTEGPADKEEEVVYNTIGEKFAAEVKAKQIDKKGRFAVKTYSDIQKTPTTSGVSAFALSPLLRRSPWRRSPWRRSRRSRRSRGAGSGAAARRVVFRTSPL